MPPNGQSALVSGVDGMLCAGEIMASMDKGEGMVIATLDAEFHCHIMVLSKGSQQVEYSVVDTVGSCTDNESCDCGMPQGFFIAFTQKVDGSVGVAIGLEIGEVLGTRPEASMVEKNAFVKLCCNALYLTAVGWAKSLVGAERAASRALFSVAVRAGKTCIDRQLQHSRAKMLAEIGGVCIVVHVRAIDYNYNVREGEILLECF